MAKNQRQRKVQIHIFPPGGGILVDKEGEQDHRSGTLNSHEHQASDALGTPVEVYRKMGKGLPPSKIAARYIMKDTAEDPGNDLSTVISLRARWFGAYTGNSVPDTTDRQHSYRMRYAAMGSGLVALVVGGVYRIFRPEDVEGAAAALALLEALA